MEFCLETLLINLAQSHVKQFSGTFPFLPVIHGVVQNVWVLLHGVGFITKSVYIIVRVPVVLYKWSKRQA